jgi:tetratricopeptide (TPR) repeat protein
VDKDQFNALLHHFNASSREEAEGVYAFCQLYPYSQLLQTLTARAAQDNHWNNRQQLLQAAAVYSTDRSVLKEIMSAVAEQIVNPASEKVILKSAPPSDYAEELIQDLERLKELRLNFESQFADIPVSDTVTMPELDSQTETSPKTEDELNPSFVQKQSKRQRLIELAQDLTPSVPDVEKSTPVTLADPVLDPLIEELQTTRNEIEPQNHKTKKQIELIDQFIQASAKRKQPKIGNEAKEDLASTIKPGIFGDHIISETLAEILLRQGKREKAIEVYKKLIWKFPQKKAYFAALIEDLKK